MEAQEAATLEYGATQNINSDWFILYAIKSTPMKNEKHLYSFHYNTFITQKWKFLLAAATGTMPQARRERYFSGIARYKLV